MFNGFDLSTISDAKIGNTQINQIYYGSQLIWPVGPPHDYSQDYLTFVSLENNNIIEFYDDQGISTRTISISTDDGITWTQKTSAPNGTVLATLNVGERLLVKGSNSRYTTDTNPLVYCTWFYPYKECSVEGNIMSLIYSDNFIGQNTLTDEYTFCDLFKGKIKYANNLVLPATILTNYCYHEMFAGCSDLLTSPTILPATTLSYCCYYLMFLNCYNLTTTPVLPATTLADQCYREMFKNCSALTAGPILPATILSDSCYIKMFYGCSLLNWIKCLAIDISAYGCLYEWTDGVSSTGTFIKDANTTWPIGTSGIPSGWTVQNV